jgi:outer membrane protein
LVELQNNIQEDMKKLQRDNTILTDDQKQKMQQDIIAKRKDFEEKARNFQQEVNQAQNAAMQKLFNKVKGVVDSVAKSEKYDLILQKEAVQFSASDANDITPKVIAKLK